MNNWTCKARKLLGRRVAVSVLALATLASLIGYETLRPLNARAAIAPAAAPLDDNSVSPLLTLDKAMETLAARVTPAIVNVAVTSKAKGEMAQGEVPEGMQHFFGQFFGPGEMPRMRQQQPEIEHVGGSGVIISPDGYIVTNRHVVDGAVDIRVTMSDRKILKGKLVGSD